MSRSTINLGMVSSYPPSVCGIARFAQALSTALADRHTSVSVVRVVSPSDTPAFGRDVVMEFEPDHATDVTAIARKLNSFDAVLIQHEYGLYGENDGEQIVEIARSISAPTICVLHTVVKDPSYRQRRIIEVLSRTSRLVVPSHAARVVLDDVYGVDPTTVSVIPHGTHWSPEAPNRGQRSTVVSWGLLGPGKGLERMIRALGVVAESVPEVRYVIAGQTHPNVFREHGSSYRSSLRDLAEGLGVSDRITFDDRFLADENLRKLIRSADVVAIPYDNSEQVVSGVLVEAVSMGRPVVATRFPHAIELLTTGAGELVDHDDDSALAASIVRFLTDDDRYQRALTECARRAGEMSWDRVAARYRSLITKTLSFTRSAV